MREPFRSGGVGLVLLGVACGGLSRRDISGSGGADSGSGGNAVVGTAGAQPVGPAGAGPVAPVLAAPDPRRTPPTSCTADGWCGSHGDYVAIWGSSAFDIYIAANNVKVPAPSTDRYASTVSELLHWDGLRWNTVDLPAAPSLSAIWGSSADDVWVVGTPDYVMHFDGQGWSRWLLPVTAPVSLSAVSGTGPTDVWVAGAGVYHFDGSTWSASTGYAVSSVWTTVGDVWLTESGTLTLSRDSGDTWLGVPSTGSWNAVWGDQVGEPFVAGQDGALGHWTQAGWQVALVSDISSARNFRALSGLSATEVWAVGDAGTYAFWNGRDWTRGTLPVRQDLHGIWGSAPDRKLWAVGDGGTFIEIDGASSTANQPSAHAPKAIWGAAPSDVWAVGQDIAHWDGVSWTPSLDPVEGELNAVWGSATNDVWAVGQGGTLLHFDGTTWDFAPAPTNDDIAGVWGSAGNDVWAVATKGSFLHFDGATWTLWPADDFGPLAAIAGNSASEVVAVGSLARVRFDGKTWSRLPARAEGNPTYLTAFADGTNVFFGGMVSWSAYKAGGAHPQLGRWDGSSIFDNLEPTWGGDAAVAAGWASSANDVWLAVPMLAHWDGAAWTHTTDFAVTALGGTSADLWAATSSGQMLRLKRH